jgi:hypothetical protein
MVDQTDNFLVPRALFKAAMVNKKIMLWFGRMNSLRSFTTLIQVAKFSFEYNEEGSCDTEVQGLLQTYS